MKISEPVSESPRQIKCPECDGTGFFRRDVPVDHKDFGKLIPCSNPTHNQERLNRLARASDLRPQDTTRRLSNIRPTKGNQVMLDAARQIIRKPRGWLYLHGGPGNAKSEVLIAIVNEININGNGPAMYVKFARLIDWMRAAFGEHDYRQGQMAKGSGPNDWQHLGYIDRFERIKTIRVLAVDEFDKARLTEFAQEFRFDFFDERYRQAICEETVTIFASQTPPALLPDSISSRILDGRFRVVHNEAGDGRPNMRWTE